eukprot:872719-Amphidinium_carterae.1
MPLLVHGLGLDVVEEERMNCNVGFELRARREDVLPESTVVKHPRPTKPDKQEGVEGGKKLEEKEPNLLPGNMPGQGPATSVQYQLKRKEEMRGRSYTSDLRAHKLCINLVCWNCGQRRSLYQTEAMKGSATIDSCAMQHLRGVQNGHEERCWQNTLHIKTRLFWLQKRVKTHCLLVAQLVSKVHKISFFLVTLIVLE